MLRLACSTDPGYADAALADVDKLLVDHAHCEHKAAVTALSFVSKYPDDDVLVHSLANLARDEASHFAKMVEICTARGLALGHPEPDVYVTKLLAIVRRSGDLVDQRVDRLLCCAFIEARSCERLGLLHAAFAARNDALAPLYGELWREEAKHHALFVELARRTLLRADRVDELGARLEEIAQHEASVVRSLPLRPAIH
jgi:tRNA 2-(methylsulfanyl)-N6-isopentenyladenosine37 hydroxylase